MANQPTHVTPPRFRAGECGQPGPEAHIMTDDELEREWKKKLPRRAGEAFCEIQDLLDIIWYNVVYRRPRPDVPRQIRSERVGAEAALDEDKAEARARDIEQRLGTHALGPFTELQWGVIKGKLAALRWASGEDDWALLES